MSNQQSSISKPYTLDSLRRSFNSSFNKGASKKNSELSWPHKGEEDSQSLFEEFISSPIIKNHTSKSKSNSKLEQFRVELTVISALNLAARDSNGLSDPYCKVRIGVQRARTRVCPKNLNPHWEEKFTFTVDSLDETVKFKVMDYDRGFRDDLIGFYEIKLSLFPLDDFQESYTEELMDEDGNENLGSLKFMIHITSDFDHTPPYVDSVPLAIDSPGESPILSKKLAKKSTTYDSILAKILNTEKLDERDTLRSTSPFQEKHLLGVLSVTLVEAGELRPMNKDGSSDPYCKFRLGHQKYRSKTLRRTLEPVWRERFEMRVYSDSNNMLELLVYDEEFGFSDNFIGSAEMDIGELEENITYKKDLDLTQNGGKITCIFNLSKINDNPDEASVELTPEDYIELRKTYATTYNPLSYLTYNWDDVEDVGVLIVKIIKCTDLPESENIIGTSDPFCIIEVENTHVRTPTLHKTQDPIWNKQFKFLIRDIHSTVNIRVVDEDKSSKYTFIGCVKLPILEAHNIHRCLLKDRKLERLGFGELFVETELIYNPVRAAIKTLLPKVENFMYEEPKFKRNLFMQNLKRVYALITVAMSIGMYIQRIYNWENKAKSTIALLLYILLVSTFELYFIPMFAATVIIYEFLARWVGFKSFETWIIDPDNHELAKEDDSDDGEEFSITAKMKMILGVCQTVQNSLDFVASYCERIINVFNWSIPFLSFMAASAAITTTITLYFLPLRWILLAWGINKLTVKLRNPAYEENQELLNFLSRLPSDVELNQMRTFLKDTPKAAPTKTSCRLAQKSRRQKS